VLHTEHRLPDFPASGTCLVSDVCLVAKPKASGLRRQYVGGVGLPYQYCLVAWSVVR